MQDLTTLMPRTASSFMELLQIDTVDTCICVLTSYCSRTSSSAVYRNTAIPALTVTAEREIDLATARSVRRLRKPVIKWSWLKCICDGYRYEMRLERRISALSSIAVLPENGSISPRRSIGRAESEGVRQPLP